MIEASGVRKSCEIEVKQRRAQPLGLGQHARFVEPLGERNALDRDRRLIA